MTKFRFVGSKRICTFGILLNILLFFQLSNYNLSFAQTGTAANPFTALGMAQNVTIEGVYYFNLSGTTFSTYVKLGGWVQVAIDFGGTSGNLPQSSSLSLSSRGILDPTTLSRLSSATQTRIYCNNGQLDVTNTNSGIISRITSNTGLQNATADNSMNTWSGTNSNNSVFNNATCDNTTNISLHQRIIGVCNNSTTAFQWIPWTNKHCVRADLGEISSSNYFQLLVQAPFVTVLNQPVINTQPSNVAQNICQNGSVTPLSVGATGAAVMTYQWYKNSIASNSGGTIISGANSSSYTPLNSTIETAYYYVVITNSLGSATSTVSGAITINAPVTTSNAGSDQIGTPTCGLTSVTLAGNTPSVGTGTWSVFSGNGGSFSTTTSPNTNFSGVSGNSYTLRWTITNGGCVSTDDVVITLNKKPIPIIAQTGCGSPITLTASTAGNALDLGSSNTTKYASIPATLNAVFSTNRITVEGWFNQTTATVGQPMLIGEAFNGDGKVTFSIYLTGQTIYAGFYNGSWIQSTGVTALSLNTWTHIAATYDQTSIKLYINGTLNASFNTTLAMPTGTEVWYLGKRWDGTTEMFSGKMDEIRIWNVARTQAEIQASMNGTVPANSPGLKAYYKLDEGSGTVAADETGNGYSATLLSSPSWQVPSTSVLGGSNTATYVWSPTGETTNSIAVISSGSYSVIGTNSIGCVSDAVVSTVSITPVPVAGNLSGTQAICVAGTTTFTSDGNTGGTWSSSATGIATVNASTGVITGVAAGTATITYTIPASAGCSAVSSTRTVTVTATPNAGVLSGTQAVCSTGSVTFTSNGNTGGAWSSSATGIATVNSTSGLITPVSAGTSTITYTITGTGGCANTSATRTVTVTTAPNAGVLSGNQAICSNGTTTFTSDGNTGGSWTSGTTSIATVNASTGIVTAIANATGSSIITYTITGTGGCANTSATRTVTVTAIPLISTHPSASTQTICLNGASTALSITASGGSLSYQWYENTTNNNSTGTVINGATSTSFTPLTTTVGTKYYYCVVTGACTPSVTSNVSGAITISPTATISNAGGDQTGTSTCGLTSVTLAGNTPTTGTGAWSIISGTGGSIVTPSNPLSTFNGTSGSAYTLRWTITSGACVSTDDVLITLNLKPVPVISQIGCGTSIYLATSPGGNAIDFGASNNSKYVSIPAGLNTVFSGNKVTVEGWFNQSTATVGQPMLIGEGFNGDGKITFCIYMSGQTMVAGFFNGSWITTSSTIPLALNTWTHVAATYDQTSIKLYINGVLNSSFNTTLALPTGTEAWYLGKRWDFNNETFSGKMDEIRIWNIAKTQDQIQAGMNTTIPTNSAGLKAYYKMDENTGTIASDATGNGYTGTLVNTPTWQIPSTSVLGGYPNTTFTWSPNGETTNNIIGNTTGTYTVNTTNAAGCVSNPVSISITVSPAPSSGTLAGNQALCVGSTTTFTTDGNIGGTWSSNATGIATVNASSGLVTGIAAGTAIITYTIPASGGCSAVSSTRTVTVTTAPNAGVLSGTQAICSNGTVTFTTNGNTGGAWSSSATGIATINASSGVISPVSVGTATMTYIVTGTGGCTDASATRSVTITTAPNAGILSGNQTICSNSSTTFTTDGNTGGTWSSGTTSIATVNATSGLITAVANASGTSVITYTITGTGGCSNASATRTVTVTAIPLITTNPSTSIQTICQNGTATALTVVASGAGLTYQWYENSVNNNSTGTIISGATSTNFTPLTTTVGTKYYYCVVSGTCSPSVTSNVSGAITISLPATIANAGIDQTGSTTCGLTTLALSANTPITGTGVWSIISGTGGSIATTSNPVSNFSGVAGNSYTLRWTITNGGCTSSDDVLITFNSIPADATLVASSLNAELLVVAGGGGAGYFRGGGGGGGGYIAVPSTTLAGGSSTTVTIGGGGSPGTAGSPSSIHATSGTNSSFGSTYVAIGGGGGGSYGNNEGPNPQNGYNGGSGGGGANQFSSSNTGVGGTGTTGQGFNGGNSRCGGGGEVCGGGGGGASAAGTNGTSSSCGVRPYTPGNGGNGIQNAISGTAVWYAGGGGGGGLSATANIQGTNGNGGGQSSYGGGGQCKVVSGNFSPESGGPGIVIVKYLGTPAATGGTITQVGGYTIHTFTSSGTFTVSGSTASAIVPNQTRCGQGTVTFTSTTLAGLTLDWYDAATGGTLLSSGTTTYTTPSISTTTTYYVSVRNSTTGCISANRLAVTATVTGGSSITANQTICAGTTPASINVTTAGGTLQWQSSTDNITFNNISGQTNASLTGATMGNLNVPTYYRAVITNGACVGNSPVHLVSVTNPTTNTSLAAGHIVWRGNNSNDWNTISNWNQYNGTNFSAAPSLPTSTSNVVIPVSNSCTTNQPNILGNSINVNHITIETGASLTATTGTINVNGNWNNHGNFTPGTGTVNFTGATPQSIGGSNPTTFYNLTTNKTTNAVTLLNPTTVTNTLTMTAGNLITTGSNMLTIGTSTSSLGSISWTSGSIIGPVKRYFGGTVNSTQASGIFPVGNASNNRYAQINFTSNPTIGGSITVEYIPGICPIVYAGLPATINGALITNYENEGYWSISPTGGNLNTTNYTLTLHGQNLTTVSDLSKIRIIKSSGHTTWNDNVAGDGTHTTPLGTNTDFTVGATGMLGFSWFNIGSTSINPLPIELIQFEAICDAANVTLHWATASEQNSAKFNVEKSRDLIQWQLVSELNAAGNANYFIPYSLVDTNPFVGISYYQLRQIDFNGLEHVFGPISVSCNSIENSFIIYPNPSVGSFNVELTNAEEEIIDCAIYDLSGKLVYHHEFAVSQGKSLLNFEKLHLQKGSYLFQINGVKNRLDNQLLIIE